MTGRSFPGKKNSWAGDLDSHRARHRPKARAEKASGHAAGRGISEASIENAARIPSNTNAPITQREGRHSSLPPSALVGGRQLTDVLDE